MRGSALMRWRSPRCWRDSSRPSGARSLVSRVRFEGCEPSVRDTRISSLVAIASKDMLRAVEDLREEVSQIRASQEQQITELHERLDFAERMLVQRSQPRAIEGAESTPV